MGKSDLRKVLDERCKKAFTATITPLPPSVIIDDMIVKLRSFGHGNHFGGYGESLDGITRRLLGSAVVEMLRTHTYCVVIDKCSYVTIAKQPEQDARDAANTELVEQIDFDHLHAALDDPKRCLEIFTDDVWKAAICDRAQRQYLIDRIMVHAQRILPDMMRNCGVPAGHTMLLDYENLDGNPVVMRLRAGEPPALADRWVNYLGEFDVAAGLYATSPEIAGQSTLIRSIDTDLMVISMLYPEECRRNLVVEYSRPLEPNKRHFHPDVAARSILGEEDGKVKRGASVLQELAVIYTLAGSDFVPHGVPGVSAKKFVGDWLGGSGLGDVTQLVPSECYLHGVVQGSSAGARKRARDKGRITCPVNMQLRAEWCLDYWTSYDPEGSPDPIGRGFSMLDDRCVYTETLNQE